MNLVECLNKELNPLQLFSCMVMLCLFFIIPLLLADALYLDDNWRAQTAEGGWGSDARLALIFYYQIVSFTAGAPNLFPLPLLLAVLAMAAGLSDLTRHYFEIPTLGKALVVLPLWYSPFFLQNLSYQYDGPGMALGVVAALRAITYQAPVRWKQILIPALWVTLGLFFYQLIIEVLVGLYCVELLRAARAGWLAERWYRYLFEKFLQLAAGLAIYIGIAYPLLRKGNRAMLLPLDHSGLTEVLRRLREVAGYVSLLINDGNRWLALLLLGLALIGFCRLAGQILSLPERLAHKLVLFALLLLVIPVLLLSVTGATLPFRGFVPGARTLMGLGPLCVAILYLVYCSLRAWRRYTPVLLCLPLACMLSFSFAYGRVLQTQKIMFDKVALQLSTDLTGNDQLNGLSHYYLINDGDTLGWLPGAYRAMSLLPALKYVLNVNFWILPEVLPRYGVVNISWPNENDPFLYRPRPLPTVANKFYDIYIDGVVGYVVTKQISEPQEFNFYVANRWITNSSPPASVLPVSPPPPAPRSATPR